MSWTQKQIDDLNNSMVAAQNVNLGTVVSGLSGISASQLSVGGSPVTASAAELNLLTNASTGLQEGDFDVLAGIDLGTGTINALLSTVTGSGFKVAYGEKTIGAASETVATGLTTVAGVWCSLAGDITADHMLSTAVVSGSAGDILIKSWKFSGSAVEAASNSFTHVMWLAIGK